MPTSQGVQERAFAEALKSATVRPEDAAAVALARRLAQLIDLERGEEGESAIVVKLAAEYRQVLAQLAMTPGARAAQTGKGTPAAPAPRSPLDELRAKRRAREASS